MGEIGRQLCRSFFTFNLQTLPHFNIFEFLLVSEYIVVYISTIKSGCFIIHFFWLIVTLLYWSLSYPIFHIPHNTTHISPYNYLLIYIISISIIFERISLYNTHPPLYIITFQILYTYYYHLFLLFLIFCILLQTFPIYFAFYYRNFLIFYPYYSLT